MLKWCFASLLLCHWRFAITGAMRVGPAHQLEKGVVARGNTQPDRSNRVTSGDVLRVESLVQVDTTLEGFVSRASLHTKRILTSPENLDLVKYVFIGIVLIMVAGFIVYMLVVKLSSGCSAGEQVTKESADVAEGDVKFPTTEGEGASPVRTSSFLLTGVEPEGDPNVPDDELRKRSRAGSIIPTTPRPPGIWTPASVAAFVFMNTLLVIYLTLAVPNLQGPNRWLVHSIMIYIGCLGASQFLEFLCTGTGTGYGKFGGEGSKDMEKTKYQELMEVISGPALPIWISWWTMEQPSFFIPLFFQIYSYSRPTTGWHSGNVFLLLMMIHYVQRSFIFPFLSKGRPFPVLHWLLAFTFCTCSGTMQSLDLIYGGRYEGFTDAYSVRAIFGYVIFAFGMFTNVHCDGILRNLRKPGETGYKIPRGGMFTYISGANLWGECVEWFGFAVATMSPTAWLFSIFNLIGIGARAVATHDWYLKKFGEEYNLENRKKFVPFIW